MKRSEASLLMAQHLKELFGREYQGREYRFAPPRKWRFDFACWQNAANLPSCRHYYLGIEIDGGIWSQGRHTRGKGYQADLDKLNTATALGWVIFRFSTEDVLTGKALGFLKQWKVRQQTC